MPWCTGWQTNGFTSVVALLPYSIVTQFLDSGCRASKLNISPLASGGPWYTDWPWCPALTPCLLLNISPIKKFRCIQFYGYLVLLMDNIQCICLFSLDVHLHMLALEKIGLVTWAWIVSHPRHQQIDKAKGKYAYSMLLLCLLNKYLEVYSHLWHGRYVDVICNTWFATRKKYQQVQMRRRTHCMFRRLRGVVAKLLLHSSSKLCMYL